METIKPRLKLINEDGNVFAIIGKALRAARGANWSEQEQANLRTELLSSLSHDNVLQKVIQKFDVY